MEESLDRYEQLLSEGLYKICDMAGLTNGEMISPDIEDKWDDYIKDYVGDAVANFNDYPNAALGFAAYLGMAVANHWHKDWALFKDDDYKSYYGPAGFDDMDDHISKDILLLTDRETKSLADKLCSCCEAILGLISHENIETQTAFGFYVLSRSYTVMFRLGASIELKRLGYRKEYL